MTKVLLFPLALAVCVVTLPPCAVAQSEFFKQRRSNEGEVPEEWKEQALALPAPPREEDLLEIKGRDLDQRYTYRIDTRSLAVGDDDAVIRYTMVIEPRDGPRHVVFEGLRCWPEVTRVYAVGVSTGFKPRADEPWQAIPSSGPFAYRHYLHEGVACDAGNRPYDAETIVDRIRRPQVRSANQDRQPYFHDKRR